MIKLNGYIKPVALLINTDVTETVSGSAVDTKQGEQFETGLVRIIVGKITGTPTSVKVKIEESDSSTFASGNTVIAGGEEVTVAQDTIYQKEIKRTKKYVRATVTVTGGTSPHAAIAVDAILCNWATPFPIA